MISFNKPHISGEELRNIKKVIDSKKLSGGNGIFTDNCSKTIAKIFKVNNPLITTSCTHALEMSAILSNIKKNDEVIMPSYTFVSTANAFALRGAKIKFVDVCKSHPCIDMQEISRIVSKKTKCVVVVHYAGIACDIDELFKLKKKYNFKIIEDCAHSIKAYYKNKSLGSFGDYAAFSFHETKNITCGEGGAIAIKKKNDYTRAKIIWQKGTDRSNFLNNIVKKYQWINIGSSYAPPEINAAFLLAQLNSIKKIQKKRIYLWNLYFKKLNYLEKLKKIELPFVPNYATINGHIFYILAKNKNERILLTDFLKKNKVIATSHYLPLHKSFYFKKKYSGKILNNTEKFSNRLLRLPLYTDLKYSQVYKIIKLIYKFYKVEN